MKELDVVLQRYINQHLPHANTQEVALFDALLNKQDPELFAWIFEVETCPEGFSQLCAKIRSFPETST